MDVCMLNQAGEMLGHQHMKASSDTLLRTLAPDRDEIVVAVEWTLPVGPGWLTSVPRKVVSASLGMPSP
jgi:hypothetical protein